MVAGLCELFPLAVLMLLWLLLQLNTISTAFGCVNRMVLQLPAFVMWPSQVTCVDSLYQTQILHSHHCMGKTCHSKSVRVASGRTSARCDDWVSKLLRTPRISSSAEQTLYI